MALNYSLNITYSRWLPRRSIYHCYRCREFCNSRWKKWSSSLRWVYFQFLGSV